MKKYLFIINLLAIATQLAAQTDADAIMMAKNNFCGGFTYTNSNWKNHWEGTFKRDNLNLGTISTNSYNMMGNYGISGKLNVLFNVPYINTKASAGTLKGQKGLQDVSLWVKYMPLEKQIGNGTISVYALAGYSTPLSNYTPDFLPLSIGLRSKTTSLRAMVDYQLGSLFATVSSTYMIRQNVTLDRTSYYTTQLHNTNQVAMPNAILHQARVGYRSSGLIAELTITDMKTMGGFDITKNNMPFVSNTMNASTIGANVKYTMLEKLYGLSFIGNINYTVAGRNVGQATTAGLGAFYIIDFTTTKKSTSAVNSSTPTN